MKTEQIELAWFTDNGFGWLNEKLSVTKDNFRQVVRDYVERTKSEADALQRKWNTNGEDVILFLDMVLTDNMSRLQKDVWIILDDY